MKKIFLSFIILSLILSGCQQGENTPQTTDKKTEVQTTENKNQTEPEKKEDDKKTEDKDNKTNETVKNESNSQKTTVQSIYIKNASIIFSDHVKSESLEEYVKKANLTLKDKSVIEITLQKNKITDVKTVESISANAVYVGLVDSNTAEFSYNSKAFVVKVSPDEMKNLNETDSNSLIHVNLKSSEDGNLMLSSFSFDV